MCGFFSSGDADFLISTEHDLSAATVFCSPRLSWYQRCDFFFLVCFEIFFNCYLKVSVEMNGSI